MYELRVRLPHLSDQNPSIERIKQQLVETVATTGRIPSFARSDDLANVTLVKIDEPGTKG